MGFTQREYRGDEILVPSSILGYRQWYWDEEEGCPVSRGDTHWDKGFLVSECDRSDNHESPLDECSCGIYAHYLPLESYLRRALNIFGVIEASGRVLMGTKGFRAEKAKIVALSGLGSCTQWFEPTEKTRGIYPDDVVDFCTSIGVPYFPTVRQMFYEFPQVDLSSLGVPPLDSWKETRDREKKQYEQRLAQQQAFVASQRLQEEELMRRYGVSPNSRMMDTFRHLGGFK